MTDDETSTEPLRTHVRAGGTPARAAVVNVEGFIDTATAPEFERALHEALSGGARSLVLNFKKTTYVSSLGWGVLLSILDEVRQKNGVVRLCSLTPEVYDIYKIMGFSHLVRVYATEEEAVGSCPA